MCNHVTWNKNNNYCKEQHFTVVLSSVKMTDNTNRSISTGTVCPNIGTPAFKALVTISYSLMIFPSIDSEMLSPAVPYAVNAPSSIHPAAAGFNTNKECHIPEMS